MSRRKEQPRQPHQRRANSSKQFAPLYHDLLDSPACHDLSAKQLQLYLYCIRESHGRATADDPEHDPLLFYMNKAVRVRVHELYGVNDGRGFDRDMAALIEHGFVDCVRSSYTNRDKNLFRLSGRWNHWGTRAFSVPDDVKTTHMLIAEGKKAMGGKGGKVVLESGE